MSVEQLQTPETTDAYKYIESVRGHYREDHAEYRGRRDEEQSIIALVLSDEARLIVDGVMTGILALGNSTMPPEYESSVEKAGFTWEDYRGEFERLLVGFGVITQRLHRDGYGVDSYADMEASDRINIAFSLFSDYQEHNALRFGVEGSGLKKTITKIRDTEDGDVERMATIVDRDLAKDENEIARNMIERGYTSGIAAHPAAKISPALYRQLRKAYPELDKTQFDQAISSYKDVEEYLAGRE